MFEQIEDGSTDGDRNGSLGEYEYCNSGNDSNACECAWLARETLEYWERDSPTLVRTPNRNGKREKEGKPGS